MTHCKVDLKNRRRRGNGATSLLLALGLVAAVLTPQSFPGSTTRAQERRADDARPRRVTNTQQQQQPTPAPTPVPQLQTPAAQPRQTPTPAAAPSPSATPPASPQEAGQEVDPEEIVKVDTSLVNLNVRVIDRANRPVNDVRQDEFKVFEAEAKSRLRS